MIEQARRIAAETQAFFDAPDTIEETDNAENHETGDVHRPIEEGLGGYKTGMEEVPPGQAVVESGHRQDVEGIAAAGAEQDIPAGRAADAACDHQWPEDPDEDTRCPRCQMMFVDWVNS